MLDLEKIFFQYYIKNSLLCNLHSIPSVFPMYPLIEPIMAEKQIKLYL